MQMKNVSPGRKIIAFSLTDKKTIDARQEIGIVDPQRLLSVDNQHDGDPLSAETLNIMQYVRLQPAVGRVCREKRHLTVK